MFKLSKVIQSNISKVTYNFKFTHGQRCTNDSLGCIKQNQSVLLSANLRNVSTTTNERQNAATALKTDEEEDFETFIPPSQPIKKGPARPPFVKNLFLGKFDKHALTYPEVLDKDRHETLHEMLETIDRFYDTVDSESIDKNAEIPEETLNGLKELGLYGMQIPEEYGGLGLGATEYARINEIIALDGSIAVTLAAHQAIGLKGILIVGNEAQKKKYLPRLATGEWTAAFCLTEPGSGSDAASIQAKAELQPDGKTYLLNGNKIWISNGCTADLMTVFAKVKEKDHVGDTIEKVTAFIVERGFGGVTSGKAEDKLGIRGSNTSEIYFENVPVPVENVLGEVGGGFKVAMNILNSGRFSMGSSGAGILKKLMGWAVDYATTRKQFNKSISEFALIKEKIGLMSADIYAMESMAYLTAGMIDSQENADCSVEAAVVKVFSSEACWKWSSEALQILGGIGYTKNYPFERYLRDARILLIFEGTNEILRLFIALNGIQHAGKELQELVRKVRNPFMNPGFVTKLMVDKLFHWSSKPIMDIYLKENLHPTLSQWANKLEINVKNFQFAVRSMLASHGKNIADPQNQRVLVRAADCAISIYAMTAVLSRASRSYCIGLENCEHEMRIAQLFCSTHSVKVNKLCEEMSRGPFNDEDIIINKIADTVIGNQGYAASHPLLRTYW